LTEGIDSSLASVTSVTTSEDGHSAYLAGVPPLTWMTCAATVADLIINRVLVLLGSDFWSPGALVTLGSWGSFARNLSVVSALVAFAFCIAAFASPKSGLPVAARVGITSFGSVLIPMVAAMTFLPSARTGYELVLVVAGLAHAIILLVVLAGLQPRTDRPVSAALILTLVAAFSGVISMVVAQVGERTYWAHAERLSNAFRWSGELAYLALPIAIGLAVSIPWREARGKLTIAFSALAAAAVAAGMLAWKHALGRDLPTLLYSAFRLDFLPDEDFVLYAIPLSLGAAVTVAATMSKDPIRRQLGAALLLLLTAGYAPRTTSALLLTALGAALLARAGIALARGRGR